VGTYSMLELVWVKKKKTFLIPVNFHLRNPKSIHTILELIFIVCHFSAPCVKNLVVGQCSSPVVAYSVTGTEDCAECSVNNSLSSVQTTELCCVLLG